MLPVVSMILVFELPKADKVPRVGQHPETVGVGFRAETIERRVIRVALSRERGGTRGCRASRYIRLSDGSI